MVLGSTGMAGHMISNYLQEKGHTIFRLSRSEKDSAYSQAIDVTNIEALDSCFNRWKCDAIVNCIGLLQKSCEDSPDMAVLINSYLPHYLERKYKNSTTKIIHLSTDCVFSGIQGNYKESDFPDGQTMYDRTKALGEIINNKDITFRMSIVGPDIDKNGTGLFNWFMKQKGVVYGYQNAMWNGITTLELAKAIDSVLTSPITGLYQLVPAQRISKFDLLCLFKEIFVKKDVEILSNIEFISNKTLVNTRTDFTFCVSDYRTQVEEMKKWIISHAILYPHYYV